MYKNLSVMILLLCVCYSYSVAQEKTIPIDKVLSKSEFGMIINRQFSKLITGQSSNLPGSFASVTPLDKPTVSFTPGYMFNDGNIALLKISAGITDGISEIFRNSEVNTNFSLGLQYHVLGLKQTLIYDLIGFNKLKKQKADADNDYKLAMTYNSTVEKNNLEWAKSEKKSAKEKLIAQREEINMDTIKIKLEMEKTEHKLDSLKQKVKYFTCDQDSEPVASCCKMQLFDKQSQKLNSLISYISDFQFKYSKNSNIKYFTTELKKILEAVASISDSVNYILPYQIFDKESEAITNCCKMQLCNKLTLELKSLSDYKSKLQLMYAAKSNEGKLTPKQKEILDAIAATLDSLNYKIAVLDHEIFSTSEKIKEIENLDALLEITGKDADVQSKIEKDYLEIIRGFGISWFSFGFKVQYDKFKLFSSSVAFSDQVKDTSDISNEFRIQYSYFKWSKDMFGTLYYNWAAIYRHQSNYANLSALEINEQTNYGTNPGDRTSTKRYTAYKGNYIGDFDEFNLSTECYYFFYNKYAFHIYPDVSFSNIQKPVWNFGAGLVFAFSGEKEGSVVNAEIYYTMRDLNNVNNNDLSIFNRNSIGLRFSFPFNNFNNN